MYKCIGLRQVLIRMHGSIGIIVNWFESIKNILIEVYSKTENHMQLQVKIALSNIIENQTIESNNKSLFYFFFIC